MFVVLFDPESFAPKKKKKKKVVELFGVECGGMRAHICADDDDLWFIHLYGFLSVKKKTILDSKSKVVLLLMAPKEKGATGRQKLDGHPPPFLSSTRTFADRRPLTLLTLLFIGPASAVYPFRAVKRRERPFSSPFFHCSFSCRLPQLKTRRNPWLFYE